jgi:hypothetical protein
MLKQDILECDETLLKKINYKKHCLQKQEVLNKQHITSKELDELFVI